jgi:hypothetical protein
MLAALRSLAPPVIAAIVIYAGWHTGPLQGLLVSAACLAAYLISLKMLPKRRCVWCKGKKEREDSWFWAGTLGRCWVCKGTGRRTRWGVMLLMRGTYRDIKAGRRGVNY